MMKKNRTGKIIGLLLVCISAVLAAGYFNMSAVAKSAEIIDCDSETHYQYGETFSIPDGKLSYKGVEKEPEAKYLVFPSGKVNEAKSIVLSEEGQYSIVYKAEFDGVQISAKKNFHVNKRLLAVNDEKSSADIVDNKIDVSLVSEDVFTYNEVLDLTTSNLDEPLLAMEVEPKVKGTPDVTRVMIRLTDIYDENNYVTITLKSSTGSPTTNERVYISVGASEQPTVGLHLTADGDVVHRDNTYGTPVYFSMYGLPASGEDTQLKLYFDYEEKAFYADREIVAGGGQRIIADLDDIGHVGEELWEGFTTGEARLTIFAENYQSTEFNFSLCKINGDDEFSEAGDIEPPVITVDADYEKEQLPTALVGKPYRIFDASAFDKFDGKLKVITAAYYKYYSAKPVKLSVTDGAFTPTKEGNYVIEYSAADMSGNIGTECLTIQAVKGEGLQMDVLDAAAETTTGVSVKVISGISYRDNSGKVSYDIVAKNKSTDEKVKIDNTHEFCPMSDGEWEITVTAKDHVSKVSKKFTLTSNHTSQPQVYDTTAVQRYFILGATYEMSELCAYDFSSGEGVKTPMDIYVTENGSGERKLEGNQYIPEKTGNVTIIYRLTVDGKVCEKSFAANVVDVGYTGDLCIEKYFVATKGQVSAEKSATNITYSTNSPAMLEFINFVQVKNLAYSFQVGEANNYNRINFYLTDTVTGKQVKFSYKRAEAGTVFSINDGVELPVESTFDGNERNFALAFYNDERRVSASVSVNMNVAKYLDGSDFEGFTNSVAFFAVELEEVTGKSQLVMNSINAHSLNNTKVDRFGPQIIVDTNSGDRGINEEVTIKGVFAYDTLNPICNIKLVITGPDDKCVEDTEGVKLDGTQDAGKDYTFKLKKYGDYTITYTAEDGSGKSSEYVYAISSKDFNAPTVSLKRHKTTARQDATVKVAKANVSDDITKECTVLIYVFNPAGVCEKVVDGKFKAEMKGIYTVKYMVSDENGNYTFVSYEINVK